MKRLLWPVCIILIAIVLFSVGGDEKDIAEPGELSVSEAAFAVRTSACEDATAFLVGNFRSDQGTRLNFDGSGAAEKASPNLNVENGSYELTQTAGGTALLQIRFGNVPEMYTFQLMGPTGEFRLTDADGNYEIFDPIVPGM